MGLLDDAIREHLELKRRRGADPAEVARQQRAVLDSNSSAETGADPVVEMPSDAALELHASERVHDEQMPLVDDPGEPDAGRSASTELESHATADSSPGSSGEPADTVQETVELDMQREFEQDEHRAPGQPEPGH